MKIKFRTRLLNKLKSLTIDQLENFTRKYLYYTPTYSRPYERVYKLDTREPEIFNRYGERMKVFFLADGGTSYSPYGNIRNRYFLWDRYNYGLKTHFYTQLEAFNTVWKPDRKFAMLTESRAIIPSYYKKYVRNKKYIENEFEALFTYDDEILDKFSNAKFMPFNAGFWYGNMDSSVSSPQEDEWKSKSKNISILASNKSMCELHNVRKNLALKCKREGLADTFGTFDGGHWINPDFTLKDYRFSFAIENDITNYFFTEKITNCFAAQTIPVYLGAQKIDEFFNPDGIIKISLKDIDNIEKILAQCTPQEYERRLPAVLDNFKRVQEYANINDYLYKKYFM